MKSRFSFLIITTLFALCCSTKLQAHVERYYYLKGKLGQREMAVKMLCYDEIPTRHVYYFFNNDKRDQYLTGKSIEGVWEFRPEDKNNGIAVKTLLAIVEEKNGSWHGSYTDSAGVENDIALHPIQVDSIDSPFRNSRDVREMNPYEQYRLANVRFDKYKTEKQVKNLVVNWYRDKESGISFFRLASMDKQVHTDSIDEALTTIHLAMVTHFYQQTTTTTTNPLLQTNITYLSKQIVSYEVVTTGKASSQQSLFQKQFFTLSISNGQPINLEDLIWFDEQNTPPSPGDLYRIYKYRNRVFAPKLFTLLQELYPTRMKSDSCGVNRVENWATPVWKITNKGVAFGIRSVFGCALTDWAIIPFGNLTLYLQDKYRL